MTSVLRIAVLVITFYENAIAYADSDVWEALESAILAAVEETTELHPQTQLWSAKESKGKITEALWKQKKISVERKKLLMNPEFDRSDIKWVQNTAEADKEVNIYTQGPGAIAAITSALGRRDQEMETEAGGWKAVNEPDEMAFFSDLIMNITFDKIHQHRFPDNINPPFRYQYSEDFSQTEGEESLETKRELVFKRTNSTERKDPGDCNPLTDKYRRIDGLCNHRDGQGSAGSTLRRLVPNAYKDGEWSCGDYDVPREAGAEGRGALHQQVTQP